MKFCEAGDRSEDNTPHLLLREGQFVLPIVGNFLKEVSIACKVHYNAEVLAILDEGFLVANDGRMLDGSEYSDFVKRILSFLNRQRLKGDLLQSVLFAVTNAVNFENLTKRPATCITTKLDQFQ